MEKFHFGGYATKYNIKCTDGRTISPEAFSHCDGKTVPIAWQHNHMDPAFCIGKGLLECRDDGVYIYGEFNDTPKGKDAHECVMHGDVNKLSIYANHVKENNGVVSYGDIKEVSLVYAGANSGAYIDTVSLAHEDGSESGEVIIYSDDEIQTNVTIEHSDKEENNMAKENSKEVAEVAETAADIIDTMDDKQRDVMLFVAQAFYEEGVKDGANGEDSDDDDDYDEEVSHSDEGDYDDMVMNAFEANGFTTDDGYSRTLAHADFMATEEEDIFKDAKRCGSFRDSLIAHAAQYGINDISEIGDVIAHEDTGMKYGIDNPSVLFPEAKMVGKPYTLDRDQAWVSAFMGKTNKVPFSKIKSAYFNITGDEARAYGYTKGEKKVPEVIKALSRTTEPATVIKMQAFDRDDIIDMDFDAVGYILPEMRSKLNEELAVAALITDGRAAETSYPTGTYSSGNGSVHAKIPEDHIRPIWKDNDTYTIKVAIDGKQEDGSVENLADKFIESVIRSRKAYRGSGNPILFTTEDVISELLLQKDKNGHFMYKSLTELATVLRVSDIQTVEQIGTRKRKGDVNFTDFDSTEKEKTTDDYTLLGVIVNPKDYTFGSVRGGEITSFNDFDIDYNQYKYLIETRLSGALTVPYSAITIEIKKTQAGG